MILGSPCPTSRVRGSTAEGGALSNEGSTTTKDIDVLVLIDEIMGLTVCGSAESGIQPPDAEVGLLHRTGRNSANRSKTAADYDSWNLLSRGKMRQGRLELTSSSAPPGGTKDLVGVRTLETPSSDRSHLIEPCEFVQIVDAGKKFEVGTIRVSTSRRCRGQISLGRTGLERWMRIHPRKQGLQHSAA